jgi:hypothetical protein
VLHAAKALKKGKTKFFNRWLSNFSDPLGFNADPDPAFYLNADPDPYPGSQTNADPSGSGYGSWSDFVVGTKKLELYLMLVICRNKSHFERLE